MGGWKGLFPPIFWAPFRALKTMVLGEILHQTDLKTTAQPTRVAQDSSPHLCHLGDGLCMVARTTSEQYAPLAPQDAAALGVSPKGGK